MRFTLHVYCYALNGKTKCGPKCRHTLEAEWWQTKVSFNIVKLKLQINLKKKTKKTREQENQNETLGQKQSTKKKKSKGQINRENQKPK